MSINSRKQVIANIAVTEKKLIAHQQTLYEHQEYLLNLIGKKNALLIFTLLPPFILGWTSARLDSGKSAIKRLLKFIAWTVFSPFKKVF